MVARRVVSKVGHLADRTVDTKAEQMVVPRAAWTADLRAGQMAEHWAA